MTESDSRGAALIERLLADPSLRSRFRTDPSRVMREHGLDGLADQLDGPALRTLELRQSRSSLAGALFAAAAEGVALAEMGVHAAPALAHDAAHLADEIAHPHHARPAPAAARSAPASQLAPVKLAPLHPPQPAEGTTPGGAGPPNGAQSGTTVIDPSSPPAPSAGAGAQSGTTVIDPGAPSSAHHAHHGHPGTGTTVIDPAAAHAATHDPHRLLTYPGDDATPRQIALWMGAHAVKAGLPPELPVMAALTESGLRNVPYGDRDSLGFFQMRTSIWDNGGYAGYPDHPERQLQWFIDQALAVRQANPALGQNPASWGEWVADIEQPAAPYRGRYAEHLAEAQALVGGFDFHAALTPPPSPGKLALAVAERFLGTPYDYGGSTPRTGFDCSGLVQYSFAQVGIHLPRVAADQFEVGLPVAREDLQPGDAVFFADSTGYVHHVGLYIGNGEFIAAPRTGEDVKIDSLSEPYFAEQYAGARRFLPAAGIEPSFARSLPTIAR